MSETENVTPEQQTAQVKANLNRTLITTYNNLFNFINGLPIDDEYKRFSLMTLTNVRLLTAEAIELLQFTVEKPPLPEGNQDATQEGVKQEGNQPEHPQGSEVGQTAETSGCDSSQQSGQEQQTQEEVTQPT